MFVERYLSILEQFMCTSEQKLFENEKRELNMYRATSFSRSTHTKSLNKETPMAGFSAVFHRSFRKRAAVFVSRDFLAWFSLIIFYHPIHGRRQ